MLNQLLNFGIVGIGGRPKAFLDAFSKTGRARLAAVCDRNPETMAEAMQDLPDVRQYTDYAEMLTEARQIATGRMAKNAEELGADAVVGMRYASASVMQGAAEVIAYGTAVKFV